MWLTQVEFDFSAADETEWAYVHGVIKKVTAHVDHQL